MDSVKRNAPDPDRIVILCDKPGLNDAGRSCFTTVPIQELNIPDFQQMVFRYSILELNTAVKPYAFKYLINERGYENVIFFDPDIEVYAPLDSMRTLLDKFNIVLTPHLTHPVEDKCRPNEVDILRSGTYNLGFIGVRKSNETLTFLGWWANHTLDECFVDPDNGIFVDQKWIDLIPGLFEGVHINRDPGWNVGYWNLGQRIISVKNHKYQANDSDLVFFHFSGYRPLDRNFSVHQNRYDYRNLPFPVVSLLNHYRKRLVENGLHLAVGYQYDFGSFRDRENIPDVLRSIFHKQAKSGLLNLNPDDDNFKSNFYDYLNQPAVIENRDHPIITLVAYEIFLSRIDLVQEFPYLNGPHGTSYANWFVASASRTYGISQKLIDPVSRALKSMNVRRPRTFPLSRTVSILYNRVASIRSLSRKHISNRLKLKIRKLVFR